MSNELTPQQLQAAPGTAPGAPAIELGEIQGDILIGLQKFFERFVFFQIKDAKALKAALGKKLAHRITTARAVLAREFLLRDHKNQGGKDPLPNVGLNLGFTKDGIQKLVPGADLKDASFAAGAQTQAGSLGDPLNGTVPAKWLPDFLGDKIDGVFLITGGTKAAVDSETKKVLGILGAAVTVVHDETGNVRPGAEKGHEHFGWLDGVSQPAINGLSTPFPGQRLMDPGHFVFGYTGEPSPAPLPWMNNGSFMVFRRLNQLVPEFDQYRLDQANTLGTDPVLLGARLVGRWKSGAPLELTPSQDDTTLGPNPQQNNNFDFSDDQAQRRCPFGAHIRKTNPREDFAPAKTQDQAVDPHRIMRAGIPFGPEVSAAEDAAHTTQQERGLMFVCYQTSIPNQFEFVQSKWANNPGFISPLVGKKRPDDPKGTDLTVGFDPIIGQNKGAARTTDEPVPNYPAGNVRGTLNEPNDFIVATGGAYFFMPSIAALENELSA
jgi:Dyp-type peroxidase family